MSEAGRHLEGLTVSEWGRDEMTDTGRGFVIQAQASSYRQTGKGSSDEVHGGSRGQKAAASGASIDMEACFSQLTLDVIGKAVFNYDFDSLKTNSPVIQVGGAWS